MQQKTASNGLSKALQSVLRPFTPLSAREKAQRAILNEWKAKQLRNASENNPFSENETAIMATGKSDLEFFEGQSAIVGSGLAVSALTTLLSTVQILSDVENHIALRYPMNWRSESGELMSLGCGIGLAALTLAIRGVNKKRRTNKINRFKLEQWERVTREAELKWD